MPQEFRHGIEHIIKDVGTRAIRTAKSSIIGLIGTAPLSENAVAATLDLGLTASNNAVRLTAVAAGLLGNDISVRIVTPSAASQTLTLSLVGKAITISLATNSSSVATTTASQLLTALAANSGISALVTAAAISPSTGAGVVTPTVTNFLSGGKDEAFPLNKPVLLTSNRLEAARLGTAGSLPDAIKAIYDQIGAMVVVVRVAQVTDDTTNGTITNIIGGVNGTTDAYEGVQAFYSAMTEVGVKPKILIAPGFTHNQSVLTAMVTVADRLRAIIVADGPNTTDAAVQAYAQNFGSKRIYLVDPGVKVFENGADAYRPASSRVAGIIAQTDNDLGFWWSPSNKEINGITGTKRGVDFAIDDANCRANILNSQNITTIIRKEGFRVWGNRTLSADQKWAFLSVVRVSDIIAESIIDSSQWAVDRNITKTFLQQVADSVTAYLQILKAEGAIIGGKCWADPDLNTPENIAQGKVYFNYDFGPVYPAEHITFSQILNNEYLTELVEVQR